METPDPAARRRGLRAVPAVRRVATDSAPRRARRRRSTALRRRPRASNVWASKPLIVRFGWFPDLHQHDAVARHGCRDLLAAARPWSVVGVRPWVPNGRSIGHADVGELHG